MTSLPWVTQGVGYALVVSGLADLFVTRLKRSGRMIGYEVTPRENHPPDVNTLTFLINPAYTMNGSLDGLTGSAATSDRFHRHVPAMRAQYGSRYPASYYRLEDAYQLKAEIERKDREREAYFQNFDASTLSWIMPAGASYNDGSLERRIGSTSNSDDPARAPDGGGDAAQAQGRQEAIDRRYADRSAAFAATDGMRSWQKNMNQLRLRAGKRNIVNTYVWDADGGLRSEAQQFASTIEHSIGSVMDTEVKGGLQVDVFTLGVGVELTVQKTISWPTSPPGSES